MTKRLPIVVALLALFTACAQLVPRAHAQATVTITDTIRQGSPPQPIAGRLVITWDSFTSAEALAVPGGYKTIDFGSNGSVSFALVPNIGATPAGTSYSVEYFLPGQRFTEVWVIPAGPGPYTIADVRVNSTPDRSVTVLGSQISGPVASSVIPTGHRRRTCIITVGSDGATAVLTDLDLAPLGQQCFIYANATIVELRVSANAGTPSVSVARNRAGNMSNLTASALATGAAGAIRCANVAGSGTGVDGLTTCTVALTTTALQAGDYLDINGGAAGGTAKRVSVAVTFTID